MTSREPTRLAAERLYPVRPLEVPDASASDAAVELERYGAVAMFCDRARARDPAFALDESNAPPVCEICRRLDGLPLALELAAARTGLLSAPELAARLDRALAVLVGGARDAPKRQRTLRATIDWSYDLLTSEERSAFAHMAVFAGGATVATAETVTGASLDVLDSLVAKQLLARRDERLLMLETVREYALERLAEEPDRDAVHERLATWCLDFLREATAHLVRGGPSAMAGEARRRAPERAGGAVLGARARDAPNSPCSSSTSWATIGCTHITPKMGFAGSMPPWSWDATPPLACEPARCSTAGASRTSGGQTSPTATTCKPASSSTAPATTPRGIAACLGHLAFAETWVGNYDAGHGAQRASSAIRRARAGRSRDRLCARRWGRRPGPSYEEVASRARSAMPYLHRVGNLDELARVCGTAGYVAIAERRYREALAWLDEALDAARRLDDPSELFAIHGNQGLARLFLHELEDAGQHFCDALAVCREAGA